MTKRRPPGPTTSDLQARLRGAGLRCTGGRLAVLRALEAAKMPVTHAELAAELVPLGYDKTTVYRNLTDLAEAGLVVRNELGDHLWRFELRRPNAEHGEHPHFLCTTCGEVRCLSDTNVSIDPPRGRQAAIGKITEVLLKGQCGKCVE